MAEVVADRLLGGEAVFPGVDDSTKLKLAGQTQQRSGQGQRIVEHGDLQSDCG